MCLIGTHSENGRLGRLKNSCMIDFQIPKTAGLAGLEDLLSEHSAPIGIGRRFGRPRRDSRSHLQNFENEANVLALLHCYGNW